MREFFRGWRRKTGCVTLVMACALIGAWLRSYVICDEIQISDDHGDIREFASVSGWLYLLDWSYQGDNPPRAALYLASVAPQSFVGCVDCSCDELAIPYWLLIAPLCLLSAYWILWKPSTT